MVGRWSRSKHGKAVVLVFILLGGDGGEGGGATIELGLCAISARLEWNDDDNNNSGKSAMREFMPKI